MAREIDMEIRERAEEFYIIDGLTFDQVAETTGVHVNTIKGWAKDEDWRDRRREYRGDVRSIKLNKTKLMRHLLETALTSSKTDAAYAFARLEEVTVKGMKDQVPVASNKGGLRHRDIETPEDAVTALRESIQYRLNSMLSGDFTSKDVADVEKSMKLVEKLEGQFMKDKPESKRKRTLDDATKKEIRDIYGL